MKFPRILQWLLFGAAIYLFLLNQKRRPLIVIGHRGAAGLAPENTLAALQAGFEQGARWLEIDVQRTRDGVLVALHDNHLERTSSGAGHVKDIDYAALCRLDAGSWYGDDFAGEGIPSLEQVFDFILPNELTLCIEMKDPALYPGIGDQLLAQIRARHAEQHVVILSFDLDWLRDFHASAPDLSVGGLWVWMPDADVIPDAQFVDVDYRAALYDPTLVWRARRSGRQVIVWTVNDPLIARLLYLIGVDAVTTDRPDLILPLV